MFNSSKYIPTDLDDLCNQYLAGNCVWLSNLVAPVASTHRDDGQLGQDDGPTDGCGNFLGALHAQTHMAIVVTHSHKSL